jgi:hypothetical protein
MESWCSACRWWRGITVLMEGSRWHILGCGCWSDPLAVWALCYILCGGARSMYTRRIGLQQCSERRRWGAACHIG